jgi:hypothetical protein
MVLSRREFFAANRLFSPLGRRSYAFSLATSISIPLIQAQVTKISDSPRELLAAPTVCGWRSRGEMRENDASCVEITHASHVGGEGPRGFQAD